jgi:hypothetical protein
MCEIIDITIDAIFEAFYICCWFSFLSTIFYNIYIIPLKYKQYILYSSIIKIRNILNSNYVIDEELSKQLYSIQEGIQFINNKLDKKWQRKYECNHIEENIVDNCSDLPEQTHITFPHFLIISTNICRDPTICLLSCGLSSILGLDLGTCLSLDSVKKRFISYIETNKLINNDKIILNSNLKQLFGIMTDDNNNYVLKLSDYELYLTPHLKNVHR